MAADILNFLTVQATAQGARLFPAVLAYSTGGGLEPQNFVADIIGAGFENTLLNLGWRAYDRVIRQVNDVNEIKFYAYQQDDIWELFDGVNWQSAHNIAAQSTAIDGGVHTGIYHVSTRNGEFLVALYRATAGGIGYVKYDPSTDTWTSADIPGSTTQANTMGKCVSYRGRLYHPSRLSILQEFNPETNELFEYDYSAIAGGGTYAKLAVVSDRLFLFPDTGPPRLVEFAFGGFVDHGTLEPEAIGSAYTSGGDCIAVAGLAALQTGILYIWNCQVGGSGFRAHVISITAGDGRGDPVTLPSENAVVIPTLPTNLSYANGPAAVGNSGWMFTEGAFQLDQRPLFSAIAASFVMLKFNFGSFVTAPSSSRRVDWNGSGLPMTLGAVPGAPGVSVSMSQNSVPWANSNRLLNMSPSIYDLEVAPFSDGTVSRGLLLTFKVGESSALGELGSDLYFGYANKLGRPDTRIALSVGAGSAASFPGGVATFDSGTNRLKSVPPGGSAGGVRGTILYSAASGVFTPGEVVTGGTSGATGIARIQNTASEALYLSGILGGPFTPGETLTGGTSGVTATALTVAVSKFSYQIVWDVGVTGDNVPEGQWVTIQAGHYNGVDFACAWAGSATYQVEVLTQVSTSTPTTTGSPVAEIVPDTSATQITTGSPVAEVVPDTSATQITTGSPVAEVLPDTSATPITTGSPVAEVTPDTDLVPQTLQGRGSEPIEEPGGVVAWLEDGVENSAREVPNWVSSTLPGQTLLMIPGGIVADQALVLDGLVELGRAIVDAVGDAPGTTYPILDMDAVGLVLAGVAGYRVVATALVGLVVQPTLSLGVGGTFDNHSPTTALTITLPENHELIALLQPRPLLRPTEVLTLQLDGAATATTYMLEVVIYGFHRVP